MRSHTGIVYYSVNPCYLSWLYLCWTFLSFDTTCFYILKRLCCHWDSNDFLNLCCMWKLASIIIAENTKGRCKGEIRGQFLRSLERKVVDMEQSFEWLLWVNKDLVPWGKMSFWCIFRHWIQICSQNFSITPTFHIASDYVKAQACICESMGACKR
jgi:hypothetical protein